MSTFIDRLVAEKTELDEKLIKLSTFITECPPQFENLSAEQRGLLIIQECTMRAYSAILEARLLLIHNQEESKK